MLLKWTFPREITAGISDKYPELHPVILRLLFNRGMLDKIDLPSYFEPKMYEHSHDPFLFTMMEKAVDLVIKHVKSGHKIFIYGDYDADGVTSSALLYEILHLFKADVEVYIPDRISEGYGMNMESMNTIAQKGAKLIITVDNGIRNKKEIEEARRQGMDVIITDHHAPPENNAEIPDCLIINPKLPGEKYPFTDLAGVGVAFKLAEALIKKSKLEDHIKVELANRLLDLVALGTVADCVELHGENRVLVSAGLEVINQKRRPGLNELSRIAKISDKIDAWHLGWLIAPRINAAGRLEHADIALNLLTDKDVSKVMDLAGQLDKKNQERQKITESIVDQIEKMIETEGLLLNEKIVIVTSPSLRGDGESWNEGVIGLVASRISNKYFLPALIITGDKGEIKGSGRSIVDFHITSALEEASNYLERFGGHAAACGFSIKSPSDLDGFITKIKEVTARKIGGLELSPRLTIDAHLGLDEIEPDLITEIAKLEPFGEGNAKPVFLDRGVRILDKMSMGADGRHIKLKVKTPRSKIYNALGFGQAKQWKDLPIGGTIDLAYHLDLNRFNGLEEVQLKIIDIKSEQYL